MFTRNIMPVRVIKYLSPIIVYVLALISFTHTGWLTGLALMHSFLLLPLFELAITTDDKNLDEAEAEIAKAFPTWKSNICSVEP